jgi:hypothetical protein
VLLHEMSEGEVDAMPAEEQARKQRQSSRKSASGRSGGSGEKHPSVVSEWGRRR